VKAFSSSANTSCRSEHFSTNFFKTSFQQFVSSLRNKIHFRHFADHMILTKSASLNSNAVEFAKLQVSAWENILALRISLQQVTDRINTLPLLEFRSDDLSEIQSNDFNRALNDILSETYDILSYQVPSSTVGKSSTKKRKSRSIEWKDVISIQETLFPNWERVINKWHARTHFGSEKKKSSLRVFNQTVFDQVIIRPCVTSIMTFSFNI
jgi:hypothetical protein